MKKNKNAVAASFLSPLPVLIAVAPLLASCASSGLYNMSNEWCAKHLDATAARCPENQALAHRTAGIDNHVRRSGLAR
jgi:hypothetical protein